MTTMKLRDDFTKRKFAEFYRQHSQSIKAPPDLERREMGFLLFEQNTMVRHKTFRTARALQEFTRDIVPAHVYNSTAYYEHPSEEMERKVWLGADLAFDVDADHIPSPCKVEHDIWTCKNCGLERRGEAPDKCPKCASEKIEEHVWLCDVCLNNASNEVKKLTDFLTEDFGFSDEEITICFSGHRGYHVHVRSSTAKQLSSDERREIVDYVQAIGIVPRLHGVNLASKVADCRFPIMSERGWRGRIVRGLLGLIGSSSEELTNMKLDRKTISFIKDNREILSSIVTNDAGKSTTRVGLSLWNKLYHAAIAQKAANVDTVVTTDIHRLIRIPETLNGKTGFRSVEVERIENFDPFVDAIAFKGTECVYVTRAPRFRVGDETFGPYAKEKVTLPTAAAVLLVCKGRAAAVDV